MDVVVAYWQHHGRAAAAAGLDGLDVLTRATVSYRDVSVQGLDVTAVLDRHPDLVLVDELAPASLPGGRHPARGHDVAELLASGIDVDTTLNVANIESLGPLVSRITRVHPAEPVPDAFVRAGEITLVDLAPAALRRRLAQGLSSPRSRSRRRCGAISASRTWPPCGSLPGSGTMPRCQMRPRRSWPRTASASRPPSSRLACKGHPPTSGSSDTPPAWPGRARPGCTGCTSGPSITWTAHRQRGSRRTGGCLPGKAGP